MTETNSTDQPGPEPPDPTQCSGEEGFCPEHGFHRQSLKQPGYCPNCGRGDCAPTADEYEQQRQRAERAETAIARARTLLDQDQDGLCCSRLVGQVRAALAEPKETPSVSHIDCPDQCTIPDGAEVREVPRPRHAWGDVLNCPNEGCEKSFLIVKDPRIGAPRP